MDIVWIPVAVVLVALAAYAVVRIFGGGGDRRNLAKDAKNQAQNVRAAAEAALAAELKTIEDEREELEEIKVIEDDAERLQALADYANRRRRHKR